MVQRGSVGSALQEGPSLPWLPQVFVFAEPD